MKKNNAAAIFLALFVGILLQGCGGSGTPTQEPVTPAAEPAPATEPMAKAETPEPAPTAEAAPEATFVIKPGPDANEEIQEALIEAEPGDVILLEEGTFDLKLGLSLDADGVTVRGRGMDNSILSFTGQVAGSEGLHITSDDVVLEDFAVEDTKGNAIKSHSADNIVYRRVRAEWTGGPKPENGAYGACTR
jgi:hypothetical protein